MLGRMLTAGGILVAPLAWADEATMREGLTGCFTALPNFEAAPASLAQRGWTIRPGASPVESEATKPDVTVFVHTGDSFNSPGCTVSSGDVPVASAIALLEATLDSGFAGKWTTTSGYGGTKSWVVAGQGVSLVMYVLGGGNAGDGPGSGISLSVRRDN